MEKIAAAVAHTPDGRPAVAPLVVPRAINGLVSKRVMVRVWSVRVLPSWLSLSLPPSFSNLHPPQLSAHAHTTHFKHTLIGDGFNSWHALDEVEGEDGGDGDRGGLISSLPPVFLRLSQPYSHPSLYTRHTCTLLGDGFYPRHALDEVEGEDGGEGDSGGLA